MSDLTRRQCLAVLAAVPLAPLLPPTHVGVAVDIVRRGTVPVSLQYHPDAFAFVMANRLMDASFIQSQRLPMQRFDPARLPR